MKLLLSSCVLVLFALAGYSQTQFTTSWTIWCEYQQNNMQQTSDGGYIVCTDAVPEMDSTNHLAWCYLIKLDANGNTQWMKKFEKSSYFVKASDGNAVVQTSDGGYAIGTVMYTQNPTTFNSHTAINVVKTDANGNLLWSYLYPGIGNSSAYCIRETSDLGLIVSGSTVDTNTVTTSYYLLKLDAVGNVGWGKSYQIGGTGYTFYSVSQTSDGGYIACGSNSSNPAIMKTDNAGNVLWARGDVATSSELTDVEELASGGYIATGYDFSVSGSAILRRFNASGTELWANSYSRIGGSNTSMDESFSLCALSDGYTMSMGDVGQSYHGILMKVDTSGIPMWARMYKNASANLPIDLEHTSDGGYAFCSGYYDIAGNWEVSIIKTNSTGITNCKDSLIYDSAHVISPLPVATTTSTSIAPRLNVTKVILPENYPQIDNCTGWTEQGVIEHANENILIYFPNPASENVIAQLQAPLVADENLLLVNPLGQICRSISENDILGEHTYSIDVHDLPDGIYFLQVLSDQKVIMTRKIIISH